MMLPNHENSKTQCGEKKQNMLNRITFHNKQKIKAEPGSGSSEGEQSRASAPSSEAEHRVASGLGLSCLLCKCFQNIPGPQSVQMPEEPTW